MWPHGRLLRGHDWGSGARHVSGAGVQVFADWRQEAVAERLGQRRQQGASEQGQMGEEIGVA
jgi:hypothetical protein